MRTYRPRPLEVLQQFNSSKSELFEELSITFDYSLPQDWLNEFSEYCKKRYPKVGYYVILATTVWVYSDEYSGPMTCCDEVKKAFDYWVLEWKVEGEK